MVNATEPTDNWRHVTLHVTHCGPAPKKQYGPAVYKFWQSVGSLLLKQGWHHVKSGRTNMYLGTPDGKPCSKMVAIDVQIPTKECVLAIARTCHADAQRWQGYVGDWYAYYYPESVSKVVNRGSLLMPIPDHLLETHTSKNDAYFSIGFHDTWEATVKWTNDGERFSETTKNVVERDHFPVTCLWQDDDPETNDLFTEGAVRTVEESEYERNREARAKCLALYGLTCNVCGFNFEQIYGSIGHDYIHVHHLVPLSSIGVEYVINPVTDLVPVCPNCHAMLHRRIPPISPQELRLKMAAIKRT